ncbi:MAG: hypothetical protein QMC85_04270 [Methanocellales archaeon]|nr:hypothetical protein [Methanocellales archaeon]
MLKREVAKRVFALEFRESNMAFKEHDDQYAPQYLLTPTGAKCNRIFIVGTLTEKEDVGTNTEYWRARVTDPTGSFLIYAGQYQPEAVTLLSDLQVPSIVAVVGKARIYGQEGTIYASIRPEEINLASMDVRDRWILNTAERSMERINAMRLALSSGLEGDELRVHLGENVGEGLADGVMRALAHYPITEEYLDRFAKVVVDAVKSILPEVEKPAPEPKEIVFGLLEKLDLGDGVSYSDVIDAALGSGLSETMIEDAVRELMGEGRCYEPKIGILKKV